MDKKKNGKLYTTSAVLIGLLLIEDTTYKEQSTIGNWLMLLAQVLCTNSFYLNRDNNNQTITDEETIKILDKLTKSVEKIIKENK